MELPNLKDLKIPLAWAFIIVSTGAGMVASAAVGHYRLGEAEKNIADQKQENRAAHDIDHGHDLELRGINVKLDVITKQLDSIDKKLDQ